VVQPIHAVTGDYRKELLEYCRIAGIEADVSRKEKAEIRHAREDFILRENGRRKGVLRAVKPLVHSGGRLS